MLKVDYIYIAVGSDVICYKSASSQDQGLLEITLFVLVIRFRKFWILSMRLQKSSFPEVGSFVPLSWICLRWFFTDSTMVNHHEKPAFGRRMLELFPSIEQAAPSYLQGLYTSQVVITGSLFTNRAAKWRFQLVVVEEKSGDRWSPWGRTQNLVN